jgi:hypothetical protein
MSTFFQEDGASIGRVDIEADGDDGIIAITIIASERTITGSYPPGVGGNGNSPLKKTKICRKKLMVCN